MAIDEEDVAYLVDMLVTARRVRSFMAGVSLDGFAKDEMRSMAVERGFEVIGEAAKLLSAHFRDSHPELPARQMIGLRNIIAHEYAEIDYRLLYRAASADIPDLIRMLEALIPDHLESLD